MTIKISNLVFNLLMLGLITTHVSLLYSGAGVGPAPTEAEEWEFVSSGTEAGRAKDRPQEWAHHLETAIDRRCRVLKCTPLAYNMMLEQFGYTDEDLDKQVHAKMASSKVISIEELTKFLQTVETEILHKKNEALASKTPSEIGSRYGDIDAYLADIDEEIRSLNVTTSQQAKTALAAQRTPTLEERIKQLEEENARLRAALESGGSAEAAAAIPPAPPLEIPDAPPLDMPTTTPKAPALPISAKPAAKKPSGAPTVEQLKKFVLRKTAGPGGGSSAKRAEVAEVPSLLKKATSPAVAGAGSGKAAAPVPTLEALKALRKAQAAMQQRKKIAEQPK